MQTSTKDILIDIESNLRVLLNVDPNVIDKLIDELDLPLLASMKESLRKLNSSNRIQENTIKPTQPISLTPAIDAGKSKRSINTLCDSQPLISSVDDHVNVCCQSTTTGVSSLLTPYTMDDPLIVVMGVGDYDGDSYPDLLGIPKDYQHIIDTFTKEWKYKILYQLTDDTIVYSNNIKEIDMKRNYKLRWNLAEIQTFVETARKYLVTEKHNGLIFAISGHGGAGKVLYDSSADECKLECLFAMFAPESKIFVESYQETRQQTQHLFLIPKIFLVDCCRGNKKAKVTIVNSKSNPESKSQSKPQFIQQKTCSKKRKAKTKTKQEIITLKGVSKNDAPNLAAQMANFCKVYANIEGCSVADGSINGGILLTNICKLFKDKKFILSNEWPSIIFKLREYVKRNATLLCDLENFTQLVENEATLERKVYFASKYLDLVPFISQETDVCLNDIKEDEMESRFTITNISKTNKIAVLVELEHISDDRHSMLQSLSQTNHINNENKFVNNGFVILDENGSSHTFEKMWNRVYVTLFELSNTLFHKMPINCPKGHGVTKFKISKTQYICDLCEVTQPLNGTMYGCRLCDWDSCSFCWNKDEERRTLFKLCETSINNRSKINQEICDRRMYFDDNLCYTNGQLYDIHDLLPKCKFSFDQVHSLKPLVADQDVNSKERYHCAFCNTTIKFGIKSYYCSYCKHSLCEKCCYLVIGDTTSTRLIQSNILNAKQINSREMKVEYMFSCDDEIDATTCKFIANIGNSQQFIVDTKIISQNQTNWNGKSTKLCVLSFPESLESDFKGERQDLTLQMALIDEKQNLRFICSKSYVTKIRIGNFYQCTFTTLNGIGRFGPTKINGYYKRQSNEFDTILDNKYKGAQLWTVPKTGKYKVICHGAKGGDSIFKFCSSAFCLSGGKGASVGGIIKLFKNDIIKIVCGQMGETSKATDAFKGAGGGGGGTYFILYKIGNNNPNFVQNIKNQSDSVVNIPLIIAAGGHGNCYASRWYQPLAIDGLCDSSENRDIYKYGGYKTTGEAGRGASFRNDFDIFQSYNNVQFNIDYNQCNPMSFLDGATGGNGFCSNGDKQGGDGGFGGGGGASDTSGGAGGGYIGGVVASTNAYVIHKAKKRHQMYGALSYNSCDKNDQRVMISGNNEANGKIELAYIT